MNRYLAHTRGARSTRVRIRPAIARAWPVLLAILVAPLGGCAGGIDPGMAQMMILFGGILVIPFVWKALRGSREDLTSGELFPTKGATKRTETNAPDAPADTDDEGG